MSKGKINVSVENIFPLIKKFLYSDQEIFLRELISNATDATLKLKHLSNIGESKVNVENPLIEVKVDKKGIIEIENISDVRDEIFGPVLHVLTFKSKNLNELCNQNQF